MPGDGRVHPDGRERLPPIAGQRPFLPARPSVHQGNPPGQREAGLRTFEDVLGLIGPLGRWQALIFACLAFVQFFQSMTNLAVVFFGITPEFHCRQANLTAANWTFDQIRNLTAPLDPDNEDKPDGCLIRNISYDSLAGMDFDDAYSSLADERNISEMPSVPCRSGFEYDLTVDMSFTIVNQWDLVCDRRFLVEHSQMVYMSGYLVGSFVSGMVSDFFGRKLTFVSSSLAFTVMGLLQAFTPTYGTFLAVRFFMALFNIASTMSAFCLGLEVCTSKWRVWIGGLFFIPYALGYTTLALYAYLLRDWRTMHWVIVLPSALALVFIWILPESPRWLLVKKNVPKAERILRQAAKMNGRPIPHDLDLTKVAENIAEEAAAEEAKRVSFVHVLTNRTLCLRCLNLFFNWFVNSAVYYGVSLNVSQFDGNRFINNAAAGAVEIPAYALCVPLLFWGRKRALASMLFLAGASLLDYGTLKLVVAMVGKLGITASFALVYVLTLELYPTVVRNAGVSNSSCVARLGSIIAPYVSGVSKLGAKYRWVPVLVFGGFSLAAGVLTLFLPETKGKKLPDSIEDAEVLKAEPKGPGKYEMSDRAPK